MQQPTYRRRRRRLTAEINVVPYIDVMLVLLIIFMVTAPIVTQGVKVDLPTATASALSAESKPPVVASIDSEGLYYLNKGGATNEAMDLTTLATVVRAIIVLEPERPVVVKADKAIPYDNVIQLMVLLQQVGVPSVGLMTDSPKEK